MKSPLPALGLAIAIAFGTLPAVAGDSPRSAAVAQALFDDGRRLMAEKKWSEACPKLEESYRLDPRSGTQLNLAVCHENEGRLATAWAGFHEALARARAEERPERIELAEARLKALDPRLPRLTIDVPPEVGAIAGLEVDIDGTAVRSGAFGVASPVDPGAHVVSATAAGYEPFRVTVDLREGAAERVTVKLAPLPAIEPQPPPIEPPKEIITTQPATSLAPRVAPADSATGSDGGAQRTAGWALIGGGSGIALLGTIAAIVAIVDGRAADEVCTELTCPDAKSLEQSDRATTAAHLATAGFVAGAVIGATGIVVLVTTPSTTTPTVGVGPGRFALRWSY